jgi:hypothetical protein
VILPLAISHVALLNILKMVCVPLFPKKVLSSNLLEFQPIALVVQAPSFDRANCGSCDVHRILFNIERNPPQYRLESHQSPSNTILGILNITDSDVSVIFRPLLSLLNCNR